MASRSLLAVLRSAAARRDIHALARAARAANHDHLLCAWPALSPAVRVAAFRTLDAGAAAKLFAALPDDERWFAYLGALSEGAATLLEGAPASARRLLRSFSRHELSAMRRALARRDK